MGPQLPSFFIREVEIPKSDWREGWPVNLLSDSAVRRGGCFIDVLHVII